MTDDSLVKMMARLDALEKRLGRQEIREKPGSEGGWTFLDAAVTHSSWDGDTKDIAHSVLFDLSASPWNLPAGIRAVLARLVIQDNATGDARYVAIGPSSSYQTLVARVLTQDMLNEFYGVVPCDANGDLYIKVGGDNIDKVYLFIYGYLEA